MNPELEERPYEIARYRRIKEFKESKTWLLWLFGIGYAVGGFLIGYAVACAKFL